jgi:hypothetical protein
MTKHELIEVMKKTLNEITDKFNIMLMNQITQNKMEEANPNNSLLKDAQDESMLYLSSNWSAGGFSNKLGGDNTGKWTIEEDKSTKL